MAVDRQPIRCLSTRQKGWRSHTVTGTAPVCWCPSRMESFWMDFFSMNIISNDTLLLSRLPIGPGVDAPQLAKMEVWHLHFWNIIVGYSYLTRLLKRSVNKRLLLTLRHKINFLISLSPFRVVDGHIVDGQRAGGHFVPGCGESRTTLCCTTFAFGALCTPQQCLHLSKDAD